MSYTYLLIQSGIDLNTTQQCVRLAHDAERKTPSNPFYAASV